MTTQRNIQFHKPGQPRLEYGREGSYGTINMRFPGPAYKLLCRKADLLGLNAASYVRLLAMLHVDENPPLPTHERMITVRFDDDTYEAILNEARRQRVSPPAFLARLITAASETNWS